MKPMKCPTCGSESFYVKDPEDVHEIYVFTCQEGEICFDDEISEAEAPQVEDDTETYCNNCSWHDSFKKVKIDFE